MMKPKCHASCCYCGRTTDPHGPEAMRPTKEHLIPKVLGDYGRYNIALACAGCNNLKNSRTPPEMLALAEMAERQAVRWREMAAKVDEIISERGLIAPWHDEVPS